MTHETKAADVKIVLESYERAPFIYFDGVATFGAANGAIHLELGADVVMSAGTRADTGVEVLIAAHLRCSPKAAVSLRDAIDKALEIRTPPAGDTDQSAKPN